MLWRFARLAVTDGFSARRRRSIDDGFGQFLPHRILREERRIGHNGFQFFLELGFVPTAQDELGNKVRCPSGRFTQGNPETDEIFGVHKRNGVME